MATDPVEKTSDAITDAIEALQPDEVQVEPESAEAPASESVEEVAAEPADEPAETSEDLTELVAEAKQYYGLSDSEIERAGEMLPWILARLDQQASVLNQSGAPAETQQQPQHRQEPKEDAKQPTELEAFDFAIDPDEWTDSQAKVLDALKAEINRGRSTINQQLKNQDVLAQAILETHKRASEIGERSESVSNAEFSTAMDEFFAQLPEEYADIYGKEAMASLSGNSPKVSTRNALVKEMTILAEFDAKAGRPARSLKEQAARTLRALHADKAHQAARREVDKQIKTRRQTSIARPSGRGDTKVDRHARALAAIEKFSPKLGI